MFTPTPAERQFLADAYRRVKIQAVMAIQLKVLQRLGYFAPLSKVADAIVKHVRKSYCHNLTPFRFDHCASIAIYDAAGQNQ